MASAATADSDGRQCQVEFVIVDEIDHRFPDRPQQHHADPFGSSLLVPAHEAEDGSRDTPKAETGKPREKIKSVSH